MTRRARSLVRAAPPLASLVLGRSAATMLLAIAAVLFVMWLLGLLAFHVTGGLIHLLVVLAVISLIVHLVRRPSSV